MEETDALRKEFAEKAKLSKEVRGFLMKGSEESEAIVKVMRGKPGIRIEDRLSSYALVGERVEIPLREVSEELGREVTYYDIQVVMPAHTGGRVVVDDDKFCLIGDIAEHAKALGY